MRTRMVMTVVALAGLAALMIAAAAVAATGARMTFPRPHAATHRLSLAPLPPAPADAVWLHVQGEPVSRRVERALIDQIDQQVRPVWRTPPIRFGSSGIPVYVWPGARVWAICGEEAAGCHVQAPAPAIYVEDFSENVTDGPENRNSISSALSHEIIEALIDPDGAHPEVCDPVSWNDYALEGVNVTDWTLPAYWSGAKGPYDYLKDLERAVG